MDRSLYRWVNSITALWSMVLWEDLNPSLRKCILTISWLFLDLLLKIWVHQFERFKKGFTAAYPKHRKTSPQDRVYFILDRSVHFKIKVHSVSDSILTFGTSCPLEPMTNFEWEIHLERIILISVIFFVTTSQKRDFVNSYK